MTFWISSFHYLGASQHDWCKSYPTGCVRVEKKFSSTKLYETCLGWEKSASIHRFALSLGLSISHRKTQSTFYGPSSCCCNSFNMYHICTHWFLLCLVNHLTQDVFSYISSPYPYGTGVGSTRRGMSYIPFFVLFKIINQKKKRIVFAFSYIFVPVRCIIWDPPASAFCCFLVTHANC